MRDELSNIRDIAGKIAAHLSDYTLAPADPDADCFHRGDAVLIAGEGPYTRGESKGIHIGQSWPLGRLKVSCLWPSSNGSWEFAPRDRQTITVSADRPPEAIARDIRRRLLEWYDVEWVAACKRRDDREWELSLRQDIHDEYKGLMGPAAWSSYERDGGGDREMQLSYGPVRVKIHHTDSVDVEIHGTNIDLVRDVLAFLKDRGVFVPPCEWDGDDERCTEPGTEMIDGYHRRQWYCTAHHPLAVARHEEIEGEHKAMRQSEIARKRVERRREAAKARMERAKMKEADQSILTVVEAPAEPAANPTHAPCGFQAFGFMPPCVLPAGHDGDHQDGFGGYYGSPPEGAELHQVPDSKEMVYVQTA